jgi:hypothetical protein
MKDLVDGAAISTAIATFVGWLPALAALLSIIWTVIRIYDWIRRRYRGEEA